MNENIKKKKKVLRWGQEARRRYRTIESETLKTREAVRKETGGDHGLREGEPWGSHSKWSWPRPPSRWLSCCPKLGRSSTGPLPPKPPARAWSPSRRRWTRASRGRPGLPEAGEKFKEEKVFEAKEDVLGITVHGLQVGPAVEGLQGQWPGAPSVLPDEVCQEQQRLRLGVPACWQSRSRTWWQSRSQQNDGCRGLANHHLPGPVGDGDQEPQRWGGWEQPGQGTAQCCTCGCSAQTRMSWNPLSLGGSRSSRPPAQSSSFEQGGHDWGLRGWPSLRTLGGLVSKCSNQISGDMTVSSVAALPGRLHHRLNGAGRGRSALPPCPPAGWSREGHRHTNQPQPRGPQPRDSLPGQSCAGWAHWPHQPGCFSSFFFFKQCPGYPVYNWDLEIIKHQNARERKKIKSFPDTGMQSTQKTFPEPWAFLLKSWVLSAAELRFFFPVHLCDGLVGVTDQITVYEGEDGVSSKGEATPGISHLGKQSGLG